MIDKVVATLAEYDVDPEAAKKMGAELRKRQRENAYAAVTDALMFSETLTAPRRRDCALALPAES